MEQSLFFKGTINYPNGRYYKQIYVGIKYDYILHDMACIVFERRQLYIVISLFGQLA